MENNSLKEYYINLHTLYNNAVNMLTAINQSLTTTASEVSMEIYEDNTPTTVKIPSFLYLDNKLEQMETMFTNLFNMPNSGEAWFNNDGGMYKLDLVRSNTAPLTPEITDTNFTASFELNNFIKDLVNPRTYLKVNIENLPSNVDKMFMKKIVLLNSNLYTALSDLSLYTYDDYLAALYNYTKGVDYEEYDSTIDMPIKQDKYSSAFEIETIVDNGSITSSDNHHLIYKIKLNTLEYSNNEDSSETYTLAIGDYLCIGNEYAIYKVTDVNYSLMQITIEEYIGHIALQPVSENSEMIFTLYNYDYSEYKYVKIPLEENPFIVVFIGTIYNNVRSQLSDGIMLNLNTIYMINEDGNYITDTKGNKVSYIDYYNKYCTNIGDLILGLTESAYPQLSNYTSYQLQQLQEDSSIATYVTNTVGTDGTLQVLPINTHVFDSESIANIKNYHAQKSSIQTELNTLTENINTVNNTLLTTDWSQETDLTQESLQSQLQEYYSERLTYEKQFNSITNQINSLVSENNVNEATKYRIRGVTNTSELEQYIKSITDSKLDIIGLDVEYKYKSISKNNTTVSDIGNNVFTDWNRLNNIDRQRKLVFDETTNSFTLEFVNYDNIANIIKWNQIDIPINASEDVVIRVRYKYNVGQPFVNIYSPWSDEITMSFPTEYSENVEVAQIISGNDDDVVNAKFTSKLINDGYEEHITNNLVTNGITFYHMPENIYSGFNTSDNNLISLKDKLNLMCNDIDTYKSLVQTESQKQISVYLQYDSKSVELTPGSTNKINIYNIEHISDYFIRKEMNLVIKNSGEVDVDLYSILPGNTDISLLCCNYEYYKSTISNYQRLPIFINNTIASQTLGQWIYFRENNVYTGKSVLYNNKQQKLEDYNNYNCAKTLKIDCANDIYSKDNIQLGLGYKYNVYDTDYSNINYLGYITSDGVQTSEDIYNEYVDEDKFFYSNDAFSNTVVYMYEDICGYVNGSESNKANLTSSTSISEFIANTVIENTNLTEAADFDGAFLFVNVDNLKQIITDGTERGSKTLSVGESVSIPIVFEYFLSNKQSISKQLMFDIKYSQLYNPVNYILELTANYDTTLEGYISSDKITIINDEANTEG